MRSLFWSILEKAFQRGIAAIMSFALAWVVAPSEVGYYGVAISVLTLTLMVSNIPLAYVASVADSDRLPDFDRTVRLLPALTVPVNLLALVLLRVEGASVPTLLALLPLAAVPAFQAVSISYVVRLQRQDAFQRIASAQIIATFTSVAVALPLLIWTSSVLGPSLQFMLSEATLMLLVRRRAVLDHSENTGSLHGVFQFLRTSASTIATNFTAWAQGQADRLVMLAVASPSLIGSYSFASAIARLSNDVLSLAIQTVGRPRLAKAVTQGQREWDKQTALLFRASGSLTFLACVGLDFVALPLLRLTLPTVWAPALAVTPMLVLAASLFSLTWLLEMVFIVTSSMRVALKLQIAGALLAVLVGLSAYYGLTAVGYALVARELLLTPFRLRALSGQVAKRFLWEWCLFMVGIAAVTAIAFSWQAG